jgi:hypothetical protein
MKIFGYEKEGTELIELTEVSIASSIDELEKLIGFLKSTAESHRLVENKTEMCHSHLRDWDESWNSEHPDVVVVTEFCEKK